MKDFKALLVLPASLLNLLSCSLVYAQDLSPPGLLPRAAEYSAEHQDLARREWEAAAKLARQAPVGVKKMSGDPDEKFFLHYWDFGDATPQWELQDETTDWGRNASMLSPLLPGVIPHTRKYNNGFDIFGRSLFTRDFHCPGNTHSCINSITADICCHPDQTCVSTADGPGCCPDGETCGDTVSDCTGGETSCNNGCCIVGATCEANGCVIYGKETTTTILRTVTRTSGNTATTVTGTGQTVTVFQPTTTTRTVTLGSTQDTTKTTKTTKVSPDRPILPTSISASSSSNNGNCLPGYYLCSAHFLGGCCTIGRDCHTTHCPPTGSTITIGGGVTIVQSGPTSVHGTCNNGLFSCPASVNGGCCPDGYRCGTETCTGRNGNADTAKVAPSGASVLQWAGGFLLLGITTGIGMVLL